MAREYGLRLGMDSRELERKAERSRDKLQSMGVAGATAGTRIDKGSKRARRGMQSIINTAGKASAVMGGLAAVIGSATFFTSGAAKARAFGQAMGEVSTLLSDTTGFDNVNASVQDLSIQFGTFNTDQAQALYQTISAGAESTEDALNQLTVANKLAIGGVTDVATSVDGLTTVVNSYGDQVESATDVADTLFTGVRLGKTTIDELATTIGRVTPLAANAQIEFDELTAIIATLTAQGVSTAEAVTGVRGALTAIIKPTGEAQELAKQLGIEFDLAALRAKGFQGFMDDVAAAVGDNDAALGRLFGQVEGLNAILSLTGESGAAKMTKAMEAMEQRAGAADEAFQKMKDTPDQELKELSAAWRELSTDIGEAIIESDRFRSGVRDLTGWLKEMREELNADNEELSRTEFLMEKISGLIDVLGFDDLGEALGNQQTMLGRLNMSLVNSLDTLNKWSIEGREAIMDPVGAWMEYERQTKAAIEAQQRAEQAFSSGSLLETFSNITGQIKNIGPAVQKTAEQLRAMGQGELADEMEQALQAARNLPGVFSEVGQTAEEAAGGVTLLSKAGVEVKNSFEQQISTLENEIIALQKNEQAALKAKLQEQALKEENEEARQVLLDMIDTILELTEDRDALKEAIEAEREAEERLAETRSRVSQELDSMLRKIDPVIKAERELLEVKQLLEEAERSGITITEDREQALLDYHREAVQAARATQVYEQAIRDQLNAMNQGESSFQSVQNAVTIANTALREGVAISREWLSTLEELAKDHNINVNFNRTGTAPGDEGFMEMLGSRRTGFNQGMLQIAGIGTQAIGEQLGIQQGGIGSAIGGVLGSMTPLGPIGGMIGSLLGGAVDSLFGRDENEPPEFRISTSTGPSAPGDPYAMGPLGRVQSSYFDDVTSEQMQRIVDQVAAFDRRLVQLFDPADYDRIAAAFANFDVHFEEGMASAEEVMKERFITAISAAEPELAGFIQQFGRLEEMMKAFEGIQAMRDQIDDLDNAILTVSEDPMDHLVAQLNRMDTAMADAEKAFEQAKLSGDPAAIAEAGQALKQQIIERYRFEKQLIEGIQQDLKDLAESTREFNRSIEETIAELSGDSGSLLEFDENELSRARQAVLDATTPLEGLERIEDFGAAVSNWLDTSIQRVEELRDLELERINQAIQAAQTQYDVLQDEADAILARAQQRQQQAQQRAQRAAQAAQRAAEAARQRELDALKAQLSVAEEMIAVADRAKGLLESLELSGTNPASAFSRLSTVNQQIAQVQAEFQASGSAESANRLLDLFESRLNLVTSNSLFQRGSGEFLQLYNDTVSQMSEIESVARKEEATAQDLREKIADLQGQTNRSISSGFSQSTNVEQFLSSAEQARLEEIREEQGSLKEEIVALEEEAQTVREEARDEIKALKEKAIEHYRWMQNEREEFANARNEELTTRLDEVTGGLGQDSYLAQLQEDSRGFLRDIATDMSSLLQEWRNMTGSSGAGGVGPPTEGPGEPGPGPSIPSRPSRGDDSDFRIGGNGGGIVVYMEAKVTGTVDSKGADQFVRAVGPKMKRYLDTA